ncbi:nucleotide exchange factor GrpE [Luteococcus sediminum]
MSENGIPEPNQEDLSDETRAEIDEALAAAEQAEPSVEGAVQSREEELEQQLGERTLDLQRLQAEYVNYKRRVDRDRQVARQAGGEAVVRDLMPVLDSIQMAEEHGELTGGFKMVADELAKLAERHGLEAFGAVGEDFDPTLHEALMQQPLPGATSTVISQVIQRGYRMNGHVLRPARVGYSEPDPEAGTASDETKN